ncbi:unnamed protein product, partial [Vitrella brassicaformis CCMP3155]
LKASSPPADTPADTATLAQQKGVVPPFIQPAIMEAFRGEYRRAQGLLTLGGPAYSLFICSGDGEEELPQQQVQREEEEVVVVRDLHNATDGRLRPYGSFLALRVLRFPPGEASVLDRLGAGASAARETAGIPMANGRRIRETMVQQLGVSEEE